MTSRINYCSLTACIISAHYNICCWLSVIVVTGVNRQEAQQWCLAHAFELVELNPEDLPDEDGETREICSLCTIYITFLNKFHHD